MLGNGITYTGLHDCCGSCVLNPVVGCVFPTLLFSNTGICGGIWEDGFSLSSDKWWGITFCYLRVTFQLAPFFFFFFFIMVHCLTVLKSGPAQLRQVENLGEGASSAVENYTHDYALRLQSCRDSYWIQRIHIDVGTKGHSHVTAVLRLWIDFTLQDSCILKPQRWGDGKDYLLWFLVNYKNKNLFPGKAAVLKCLLDIHKIFMESDPAYILNDLFITDYCIWIQKIK